MNKFIGTALICAGAIACGDAQFPDQDTSNDGPVPGDEIGQDEEPITVQAGVLSAIQPSPFGMFLENASQPIFRQCGTGNGASPNPTNGLVSCGGKNLLSPGGRTFTFVTNSGDFQSRLQQFCTQVATKIAWACNVSLFSGQTCPVASVCVRNASVTTGGTPYPVFDMRRYQRAACLASEPSHSATFRSATYSNRRCDQMEFVLDKVVMQGEAGSQYAQLANDVVYSIGMQAIGQGLSQINTDLAYSATFSVGVVPYKPKTHFMSQGQICRANQYVGTEDGSFRINDTSGCPND